MGTKSDLREDKEFIESMKERGTAPISTKEAQKFADKNCNGIPFLECSSLTGEGVEEIFRTAAPRTQSFCGPKRALS